MIKKAKVLIVGAGNIGITIAKMLTSMNYYDVLLTDGDKNALLNTELDGLITQHLTIKDTSDLHDILKDKDYVINAGPYFLAYLIAQAAVLTNTHYLDLTEDVKQTEEIRTLDNGTLKTVVIPQCGLAPGAISIIANHLALKFDTVHDVKMRVGALPINPTNELKYNTTWSVDGLVNEYLHPCNAIKDGSYISTEAMEGYETFNLDGDRYEAFNTSGGLGTMCETWNGKVNNMNYKTVRYPGHHYLMKFLIKDMKLSEGQLKNMIIDAIPSTSQDVVLIFVEVTGIKNGKLISKSITKKIYGTKEWSGIQLSTATGICVMLHAHQTGIIKQSGFVEQETLSLDDFYKLDIDHFGGNYAQ